MITENRSLMFATWECPHCDTQHRIALNVAQNHERKPQVITCDEEEGGCGKDAAIYPQFTLTILSSKIML